MASQDHQVADDREPREESAQELTSRLLEETRHAREAVLRQLNELRAHEDRQSRFARPPG